MSGAYAQTAAILPGEHLLYCTRCGALIADHGVTAHDRFHGTLNETGIARSALDPDLPWAKEANRER